MRNGCEEMFEKEHYTKVLKLSGLNPMFYKNQRKNHMTMGAICTKCLQRSESPYHILMNELVKFPCIICAGPDRSFLPDYKMKLHFENHVKNSSLTTREIIMIPF